MIDYWIEIDTHVSPHHHQHSDGSERRHVVSLRIPGINMEDAVGKLERALQALVVDASVGERVDTSGGAPLPIGTPKGDGNAG